MTDSLRCRWENVSACEVERVAVAHPDVEDCAEIGVAAETGGQEIKLFVQSKPGAAIDLNPRRIPAVLSVEEVTLLLRAAT